MTKIEYDKRNENRVADSARLNVSRSRHDAALNRRSQINARRLVTRETTAKEVCEILSDRRDQTTGVMTDTRIMPIECHMRQGSCPNDAGSRGTRARTSRCVQVLSRPWPPGGRPRGAGGREMDEKVDRHV